MSEEQAYQHWTVTTEPSGVATAILDRAGASANTLNDAVLEEFESILQKLSQSPPKALVVQSGKKSGFIAGADINQFEGLADAATATQIVQKAQQIFDKLSQVSFATIAVIKGFCLGGGLELALACRYRIAIIDPKTRLGLPEVLLGIQPGWGGSVRLPRLIGVFAAMDLMLTGRLVDAAKAKRLGFVDMAVEERYVNNAIDHFVMTEPSAKKASTLHRALHHPWLRPLIGYGLRMKVAKKVKESHYPAPYAMINNWVEYSVYDHSTAIAAEADSIGKLLVTDTAKNLVRVFFLKEKLKSLGKKYPYRPEKVHVIGAGVMGGDIAAWCALRGYQVSLEDQNPQALAKTLNRAKKLFKKKLKQSHLIQAAQDRFVIDPNGKQVPYADVIIEAIVEKASVKQTVFEALESQAKPSAILATNTSTIPLDVIGENLKNPGRLVGIHFFNPVAQMPLVEIVQGEQTSQETVGHAQAFVASIDKLPLPVKSAPGFLVNRILIPYVIESMTLYEEGVASQRIDDAATEFGMPMGPIELADVVGLDVCKAAAEGLGLAVPDCVNQKVQAGHLGKKSGQGFYQYKKNKRVKDNKKIAATDVDTDIQDRLVMRMLNESMACLREGIVTEKSYLDAGMIFGAGFAPFRGGPMQYIDLNTSEKIKQRLDKLNQRYGERFAPDTGWAS